MRCAADTQVPHSISWSLLNHPGKANLCYILLQHPVPPRSGGRESLWDRSGISAEMQQVGDEAAALRLLPTQDPSACTQLWVLGPAKGHRTAAETPVTASEEASSLEGGRNWGQRWDRNCKNR